MIYSGVWEIRQGGLAKYYKSCTTLPSVRQIWFVDFPFASIESKGLKLVHFKEVGTTLWNKFK